MIKAVAGRPSIIAATAAVLVSFGFARDAGAEKRVALLVGNGAYANAGRLDNPARDAQALATKLRQTGFDVETVIDQGKKGIEESLRRFARNVEGADVALFFYAGHGLQLADRNYLVPVDAKLERESDVRFEAIELREPIELIQSNAKVGIVLLDACRNNPLANRLKSRGRALGRGLAVVDTGAGEMLVVYATSPGMIAEDGDGSNSPFTTALLDHVATDGIEVQTMIKRVIGSVQKQTAGRQIPWQLSSLTSEVYLGRAPGGKSVAAATTPAPIPAPVPIRAPAPIPAPAPAPPASPRPTRSRRIRSR